MNDTLFLADILLRLAVLENLLISKGMISKAELDELTANLAEKVSKKMQESLSVSEDK